MTVPGLSKRCRAFFFVAGILLWGYLRAGVCELNGRESAPEETWLRLFRDHPWGTPSALPGRGLYRQMVFLLVCSLLFALCTTLFAVLLLACTSFFCCVIGNMRILNHQASLSIGLRVERIAARKNGGNNRGRTRNHECGRSLCGGGCRLPQWGTSPFQPHSSAQ
jgi:hypothetical protein